jgi:ubiquinone/menaquinone biosynthesis C-methylase UbiE
MKQKTIFTSGEGDKWYERNEDALLNKDFSQDLIVEEIIDLIDENQSDIGLNKKMLRLLEIGCGEGGRLKYLQDNYSIKCSGIEPSKKAVEKAKSKGIQAKIGTADCLEFNDGAFDIVLFGFCLYLCDRDDLFQIAYEADRVIRDQAFIVILDFFHPVKYQKNKYIHQDGIYSHKMDYRSLFNWHPFYECYRHKVMHHSNLSFTDEMDEWIAVSVLRKNKNFSYE